MGHGRTAQQEETLRRVQEAEREQREDELRAAALAPTREERRSAAFRLGWENVLRAGVLSAALFWGDLPLWLILCAALAMAGWWTWDALDRPRD